MKVAVARAAGFNASLDWIVSRQLASLRPLLSIFTVMVVSPMGSGRR